MQDDFDGEEYAVDTYPNRTHVDTVLAHGFHHAVVEAVAANPDNGDSGEFDLFAVHHMATGDERQVELTDELRNRIREKRDGA